MIGCLYYTVVYSILSCLHIVLADFYFHCSVRHLLAATSFLEMLVLLLYNNIITDRDKLTI
jgi:hypothetical protein